MECQALIKGRKYGRIAAWQLRSHTRYGALQNRYVKDDCEEKHKEMISMNRLGKQKQNDELGLVCFADKEDI